MTLPAASGYEIDLNVISEIEETAADRETLVYLAAKNYIQYGFFLVPLRPGGKELPSGMSYKNASRKESKIDEWFGPGGKYRGWNIGIATGKEGGTFAIDVDRHGEIDGLATLERLVAQHGEFPPVPVQETPNGGLHYIFYWQEHARSSTGKIGEGIDTRGGTEKECKGHIVVWPSVVDGRKYRWKKGGTRRSIPLWVMEKMGVTFQASARGTGRGNEMVEIDDLEQEIPLPQIDRMLDAINPDTLSYDEWLQIGMAIKSQHPGGEGLALWDKFSRRGERYQRGECHKRWEGFDPNGRVRSGTLFHIAREHGWKPLKGDVKQSKVSRIVQEMNKRFALCPIGKKIAIIEEFEKPDPIQGKYRLLEPSAFSLLMRPEIVKIVDGDKEKVVEISKIWLGSRERREVSRIECLPGIDAPEGVLNSWCGFTVDPKPGKWPKIKWHIDNIICGTSPELRGWVYDWIAMLFQKPHYKPGTALVLRGGEGAGKGAFADAILGKMFGYHYKHLTDSHHLVSNFNAILADAVFVFGDEVTYGGNRKADGKLKAMVTEDTMTIERKGLDSVTVRNMVHLVLAANDEWVIPVGTNPRRWLILDVSDEKAQNKEYFDALFEAIPKELPAFLHDMLQRKITHNIRVAPATEAREEQTVATLHTSWMGSVIAWIIEKVEKNDLGVHGIGEYDSNSGEWKDDYNPEWPSRVVKADLYDHYVEWCQTNNKNTTSIITFSKTLKSKFRFIPSFAKVDKINTRIWKVPSREEIVEILRGMGINID